MVYEVRGRLNDLEGASERSGGDNSLERSLNLVPTATIFVRELERNFARFLAYV